MCVYQGTLVYNSRGLSIPICIYKIVKCLQDVNRHVSILRTFGFIRFNEPHILNAQLIFNINTLK